MHFIVAAAKSRHCVGALFVAALTATTALGGCGQLENEGTFIDSGSESGSY